MNPEVEHLIDLATRPLADNAELRLSAESELRKSLEAHAADRPEGVKEAADALARADLHPKRGRWNFVLLAVTALVSLPPIAHSVWQLKLFSQVRGVFNFTAVSGEAAPGLPRFSASEKLLLFGDRTAKNESDKWKPLWQSEPDNPAYLAEYALAYYRDHKELSPEILAEAERVDPDNGWFPALAASGTAERAVTKERTVSSTSKGVSKTPVWKIDDKQRLADTLAAIHRFAPKSRFTAYQGELLRQRIPLFPPRRDFVSQVPPMAYVLGIYSTSIQFRKLSDAMAAGAQQCAADGDVEGFRKIVGDWQLLVTAVSGGGETMIDVLIAKVIFNGPAANFRDAARQLGLEDVALRFAGIYDRGQDEKNGREARRKTGSAIETLALQHGSVFTSMSVPFLVGQVKKPPVLTENDLRPGRYADHAVFERFASWLGVLLLGFGAASASSFRYRQSPLARRLSARMVDLFRPSDWVWVILGGIVFPILWYFCITRLTPLSGREWSGRMSLFMQQGGQFGSMVIFMLVLTCVIASRRLAKRGAVIGLEGRFQWFGRLAGVAALLAVPVFGGLMFPSGIGRLFLWVAYGLLGIAAVWLLTGFVVSIFGRESQALRRATLARIAWPVWVFGMLALVAIVPFYYAEERHWVQRDRIFEISAECAGPNRYEYQVTQILRAELLETIRQAEGIH